MEASNKDTIPCQSEAENDDYFAKSNDNAVPATRERESLGGLAKATKTSLGCTLFTRLSKEIKDAKYPLVLK